MTSVDAIRITREVTLGEKPEKEDTDEMLNFRIKVGKEIAEIKAKGWIVEIPFEFPDMD